jgi:ureidoglycolate hydrolase
MSPSPAIQSLRAQPINQAAFAPFGQVIFPGPDHIPFGPNDAQLELDQGIPRFYLMTLPYRGSRFDQITRHQRCTQCLGSLEGKGWGLAVAPPGPAHQPDPAAIQGFYVPGDCFIKLARGTWHAGPYFRHAQVHFYNLELSDTNLTDHQTCNLFQAFGLAFELALPPLDQGDHSPRQDIILG